EVEADEIFLVPFNTLFGQESPLLGLQGVDKWEAAAERYCPAELEPRRRSRSKSGLYDTGLVKTANLPIWEVADRLVKASSTS
ncbi:MAG: hypothetical protein QOD92_4265, partial [Acidimicrobiaceae bacterium]